MKGRRSTAITRRDFVRAGAGAAAGGVLHPSFAGMRTDGSASTPPNIVFIISDQHRYDLAGCYGNDLVQTPAIDRLASEGVRFESMYCQFPLCVPSRQSIITSQYASRHGTRSNDVPSDQYNLVEYLHDDHGYNAWLCGKAHMTKGVFDVKIHKNNLDDYLPPEVIAARDAADDWYDQQYYGMDAKKTRKKINTEYLQYPLIEDWHRESLFASMAEQILTQHPERPTFFWISFIKPHPKWTPPERFWQRYRDADLPTPPPESPDFIASLPQYLQAKYHHRELDLLDQDDIRNAVRAYYACVEYMDHVVGVVLDLLEQHGLIDNTIVVYTADHGETLGHNGLFFKGNFYEPSAHIPCIMRYPAVIPGGQVVSQATEQLDLMPTIFDYAGIPPAGIEQGASMRELIANPTDPTWKNEAFCEVGANNIMVRSGDWKYCLHPGDLDQMFNLAFDPDERINLADDPSHAGVRQRLLASIFARFPFFADGFESGDTSRWSTAVP